MAIDPVDIPVTLDNNLINLFFIDMIHDFSTDNLTGYFENDLQLLKKMFDSVFPNNSVYALLSYIEQYLTENKLTKNLGNWTDAAHRWGYLTCMANGKFFFNEPTRDGERGMTEVTLCSNLDELLNGKIISDAEADWETLQSGKFFKDNFDLDGGILDSFKDSQGNSFPLTLRKPVLLLEDSSKGIRRMPLLFSEVFNTISKKGLNKRNIINLETASGIYDEASSALASANEYAYTEIESFKDISPPNIRKCVNTFRDTPINFKLKNDSGVPIAEAKLQVNTDNSELNVIAVGFKILKRLYEFILIRSIEVFRILRVISTQPGTEAAAAEQTKLESNYSGDKIEAFSTQASAAVAAAAAQQQAEAAAAAAAAADREALNLFFYIQGVHLGMILRAFFYKDEGLKQWIDRNYDKPGSATSLLFLLDNFIKSDSQFEIIIADFMAIGPPEYPPGDPVQIFEFIKSKGQTPEYYKTTLQDVFSDIENYYYGNPSKTTMNNTGEQTVKYNNSRRIGPQLYNNIMDLIRNRKGVKNEEEEKEKEEKKEEEEEEDFTPFLKKGKTNIINLTKYKFGIFSDIFNKINMFENSPSVIPKQHLSSINKHIECGKTGCPKFQSLLTGMSSGKVKGVKPEFSLGVNFLDRLTKDYEPNNSSKKTFFSLITTFCFFDLPFSHLKTEDITHALFFQGWFTNAPGSPVAKVVSDDSKFLIHEALKKTEMDIDNPDFKKYASLYFKAQDVEEEPTQNPSVARCSEDFRLKLYDETLQKMMVIEPGQIQQLTNIKQNLILDKGRDGGIPDTAKKSINDLLNWNVNKITPEEQNKLWKKLFFTLFTKTMADFSQIATAQMLSVTTSCNSDNFSNVIWLISQDISMTFISLYYGSNIIQIRIKDKEPMSQGCVNYGFGNSLPYKVGVQKIIEESKKRLSNPREEEIYEVFNLPLNLYNDSKNKLSEVPAVSDEARAAVMAARAAAGLPQLPLQETYVAGPLQGAKRQRTTGGKKTRKHKKLKKYSKNKNKKLKKQKNKKRLRKTKKLRRKGKTNTRRRDHK